MWRGYGEKRTILHCWWECKLVQPPWRTVWGFLKKLGIKLPYDPAIPLLGIYPKETRTERDTHITFFLPSWFIGIGWLLNLQASCLYFKQEKGENSALWRFVLLFYKVSLLTEFYIFNRILPNSHGGELSHGQLSYKRGKKVEYSTFQYLE